jgi:hypothetical protein
MRPLTLDDLARLDVRQLARDRYLDLWSRKWVGWRQDGQMVASLMVAAAEGSIDVFGLGTADRKIATTVRLTTVPLTYGNRVYFLCPGCARRCSLIYLDELECRLCVARPYLSSTLGTAARKQDRLTKAKIALGLDDHGHAERPAGMHSDTWLKLWSRYWDALAALAPEADQLAA